MIFKLVVSIVFFITFAHINLTWNQDAQKWHIAEFDSLTVQI